MANIDSFRIRTQIYISLGIVFIIFLLSIMLSIFTFHFHLHEVKFLWRAVIKCVICFAEIVENICKSLMMTCDLNTFQAVNREKKKKPRARFYKCKLFDVQLVISNALL